MINFPCINNDEFSILFDIQFHFLSIKFQIDNKCRLKFTDNLVFIKRLIINFSNH